MSANPRIMIPKPSTESFLSYKALVGLALVMGRRIGHCLPDIENMIEDQVPRDS
jgi:hypothetical protein